MRPLNCSVRVGLASLPKGVAGDVSKGSAAHGRVGITDELRVVGHIEGFNANLEIAFKVDGEAASDARVHVGNPGSAEFVAAGVAKVGRDIRAEAEQTSMIGAGGHD